jgi:hypothetical protein
MTKLEWDSVVKRRLLAGWVLRTGETIDDAGYFSWLRPFTLEAINEALDGLAGTDWMPKANEIVRRMTLPSVQSRRDDELAKLAAAYEARHRAAGTWLEPVTPPLTRVERAA